MIAWVNSVKRFSSCICEIKPGTQLTVRAQAICEIAADWWGILPPAICYLYNGLAIVFCILYWSIDHFWSGRLCPSFHLCRWAETCTRSVKKYNPKIIMQLIWMELPKKAVIMDNLHTAFEPQESNHVSLQILSWVFHTDDDRICKMCSTILNLDFGTVQVWLLLHFLNVKNTCQEYLTRITELQHFS